MFIVESQYTQTQASQDGDADSLDPELTRRVYNMIKVSTGTSCMSYDFFKLECIPVGCVPPAAVVLVGGVWSWSPWISPLGVGLDLIPLNFPLGWGPGSDPPEFPPWVWARIWSPSISPLGVGLDLIPLNFPLGVGLDLIPLNFPIGCGPGPDLLNFPPGVGLEGGLPDRGVYLAGGVSLEGVSLAGGSPWWGSPWRGVSLVGGLPGGGSPGRGVSLADPPNLLTEWQTPVKI